MILDEMGHPVTPARVVLQWSGALEGQASSSPPSPTVQDITHAAFRFDNLPPGNYVLTASAPDRPETSSSPIRVLPGRVVRGVALTLATSTPIAPTVEEPAAAPPGEAEASGESDGSDPPPPSDAPQS